MTPLYKSLKTKGTSFYCFPSSSGDIAYAHQNQNNKMYFSKYVLLNLPKQNLTSGTNSSTITFDFDNSFYMSPNATPPSTYKDQLVESLRNYVANHEVVIKESKLNNTEYFYNSTTLQTTSEKIFWKWCKKLNLLDLEEANSGDQYFGNLSQFQSNNINDDAYFPEILWQERQVISWGAYDYYQSTSAGFSDNLQIEFIGTTNFKVGDIVLLSDETNTTVNNIIYKDSTLLSSINGIKAQVLSVIPAGVTQGQSIVLDLTTTLSSNPAQYTGKVTLVYHKLVQYIGEINGVNNTKSANRAYTEVWAHIPDNTGQTPDVLFRTGFNDNYLPNMTYPILPSQVQPEIIGAELFNNPIVNTPQNYPGSYFAQYDNIDYTYETASGDQLRRSGDYYGISGDINNPVVDSKNIDGLNLDFDVAHYVKMNIIGREITNFDQFNALQVNNTPPSDFQFNAILWYYDVKDVSGNTATNLYGISFLDNPDNNPVESEIGLKIPVYNKLAANDNQDGLAYAFSINLNFNLNNENIQDAYNPEAINSLFSFNLYNEAMRKLGGVNESFLNILNSQNKIQQDIINMKQLLYSQTDFQTINKKISNLESLLKLYSTNQMVDSDSISVIKDNTTRPPLLSLHSKDAAYYTVNNILTTELYNANGTIPLVIDVPENKNFLVYIENNDTTSLVLPNNDKLNIVINSDLSYKQSFDIVIDSTLTATQNKQLDIYINYKLNGVSDIPVLSKLIDTIDLPVYYNSSTQTQNTAQRWEKNNFEIDLTQNLFLTVGGILNVPIKATGNIVYNSFQAGDVLKLGGFNVGTSSQYDFSGQYTIDSVGLTNSYLYLDVNINANLINYGLNNNLPYIFNSNLSNIPYFDLNKGVKYKITRVGDGYGTALTDRYLIEKQLK